MLLYFALRVHCKVGGEKLEEKKKNYRVTVNSNKTLILQALDVNDAYQTWSDQERPLCTNICGI